MYKAKEIADGYKNLLKSKLGLKLVEKYVMLALLNQRWTGV